MTTREQLAAECIRLAGEYAKAYHERSRLLKRGGSDSLAYVTLCDAINHLASWQPEQQAAEPTHYASPLTGRAVRAEWLRSGATERDQDEYTIPLYTRPTAAADT
jgi:hypothetical protein